MLKLIKIFIGMVGLGAFVWWGVTVPLGERTLFQHVSAIAGSRESRELVRGTKEKVADLKKRVVGTEKGSAAKSPPTRTEPGESTGAEDHLTNVDRHDMRKLIDSAHRKVARPN